VIHKQFLLDHCKGLAIDTEYGNEYALVIIQSLKVLLGDKIAFDIESRQTKVHLKLGNILKRSI